ncbi:MAG TPA: efflux RND transporter periplasmic adaptor subunit [Chitinivibrionales bacterium]|nr:efflux RND transporter periplasmic adaptor subunit [Chitinivibrionales bacterium]
MNARKMNIPIISAAATVCIAAGAVLIGCSGKDPQKQPAALQNRVDSAMIKVVVADVNEGPFEDWGSYSADLRGIEDANLIAPAQGGRVNSVRQVGTYFKEGDGLCDIDGDKYGAALEAAKAQVAVAKGDLDRATANVQNGSLGRSAVDAANLAYQNAKMALATARRAWEDCQCQAPFDGILVSRYVDRFQTVAPGASTVRVSRIGQLEAVIAIPEAEAFSYEEGMKTEFRLLQHPEKPYDGVLRSLDRAVDSKSRTVTARIVVSNRDGALKPGMVGRANILRKKYAKAIVIPSTALVRLQNGVAVMVVENGVARQRIVSVGATNTDTSLITNGLHAGDKLIVAGAFQVSDGTKVAF